MQDDLDRKTAKISALLSGNLDKYEYLTGKDLRIKLAALQKARYEASPLDMSFSALKEDGAKNVGKSESDFNYDSRYKFFSI